MVKMCLLSLLGLHAYFGILAHVSVFLLCVRAPPPGYEVNLNEDAVTQTPQTLNPLANLYFLSGGGCCCDLAKVASGRLVSVSHWGGCRKEGGSGIVVA